MTLYRTGRKKYSMLQEVDADTGIPTGNVKPNVPGDSHYVPPVIDETACPEGPIPEPTTTTSTTSSTTTSTTTLIPDAFRVHIAYQHAYFAGVSYVPFDVDLKITDNGSVTYFDGNVTFPIYMSGNEVAANVPTRSSSLIDITVNSIVAQANWMRVMYSTNSYPNPPTVGLVLYEGPATSLAGLAVPIDYDSNQDILVIEFSTTSAAPTTTTTTLPPIETCDVFLNFGTHILLYKDNVVYTLGTQPLNRTYVDIAIIGNKLYARIDVDVDEWDIGVSTLTFITTHVNVLPGFGPGLGSDDTYLYADVEGAIYRINPSTWSVASTDMGTGYPGQGDMMLIGDDYILGSVKKTPGSISTLQTWKKLVTGSTVGFEATIMTNYSTVLNNVYGIFQKDSKLYLLTSNGLIWEYNTTTLVATQVANLSSYYSGNNWNGAAQRGSCGDDIYLTTTTTSPAAITLIIENTAGSNVEITQVHGNSLVPGSAINPIPYQQPNETETHVNVPGWVGSVNAGVYMKPLSSMLGSVYRGEVFKNSQSIYLGQFAYHGTSAFHLSTPVAGIQPGDTVRIVITRISQ